MKQLKTIRILSLIIAALICLTSWQGLVSPEIYANETDRWATQAMGQDLINIFILPFYLICTLYLNSKKYSFHLLWTGVTGYFIYTFLIYCFDVQFNRMFLFYTSILGLLCYSLFILLYFNKDRFHLTKKGPLQDRVTGVFFILLATLFYVAWLSVILRANLFNTKPDDLEQLPTNPVHVLDLSVVLPGIFIGGILLIRKKRLGYFLAPVILTFSLLMELTIGVLLLLLQQQDLESPTAIIWFIFGLAAFNLILLLSNQKKNHPVL